MRFILSLFLAFSMASCLDSPSSSEDPEPEVVQEEPSSSPLSLDEYLLVCGGFASLSVPAGGDALENFSSVLQQYHQSLESVEPPVEVSDWHQALLVYQRDLGRRLDEGPQEGQSEDDFLISLIFILALEHQQSLAGAVVAMDKDVLSRMVNADCIDEELVELALPEEERPQVSETEDEAVISEFISVGAGDDFTCGVGVDGSVVCWGDDLFDLTTPPPGIFSSVSAGWAHACGIRMDGSVVCWGGDSSGELSPPSGEFSSISAGTQFTCGVRPNGSVECWGDEDDGKTDPAEGVFVSVSAGGDHVCGVKIDGTVECWGDDFLDKATPPEGSFIDVTASFAHSCGVRADGTVVCWGQDLSGEGSPPEGEFVSVSSGQHHTCGVMTDGSVKCWGDDEEGQSSPPQGKFSQISSGSYHNCGILDDASVVCWGSDHDGQSSPPTAQ